MVDGGSGCAPTSAIRKYFMTRFLASVENVQEARLAIQYGADIVDLKNPSTGALGALPRRIIERVVKVVARRRPVSATIGDLPADRNLVHAAVTAVAGAGVNYVKVGLLGGGDWRSCLENISRCVPAEVALVAVLFADQDPDLDLLQDLRKLHFRGVMLDTADKNGARLRQIVDKSSLSSFVRRGRGLGLLTGLAGSLSVHDIPALLDLQPDYLGFRSALCNGSNRASAIDARAIRTVRECIPRAGPEGVSDGRASRIKPVQRTA